jgi:hypothetical protein
MESDDPAPPRTVTRAAKHQDELNNLGRSWFAELREQSERDTAEFETWRREHRKWTVFNKRSRFGNDFSDDPPSNRIVPPDRAPDR